MTEKQSTKSAPTGKDIVREHARNRRASLSKATLATAARDVAFQLCDFAPFLSARTILVYASVNNEISLNPALELRERIAGPLSARIAYPRTTGRRTMEAHESTSDQLIIGNYDLLEPDRKSPLIEPEVIDVVCVPGLAFDKAGYRVGYGKGFYDTYLPRLSPRATTVGVAYDDELLDVIMRDEYDVAVDYVVTPSGLYKCSISGSTDAIVSPDSLR